MASHRAVSGVDRSQEIMWNTSSFTPETIIASNLKKNQFFFYRVEGNSKSKKMYKWESIIFINFNTKRILENISITNNPKYSSIILIHLFLFCSSLKTHKYFSFFFVIFVTVRYYNFTLREIFFSVLFFFFFLFSSFYLWSISSRLSSYPLSP